MEDKKYIRITLTLFFILIILFFISFHIGRFKISPKMFFKIILRDLGVYKGSEVWDPTLDTVILQVRLPRILLAILIGGALSISGSSYQTLFRNPMVSPDILGVSAGAGFGAASAMLINGSWMKIQYNAFFFGLLAVLISYSIGYLLSKNEITILVISGVVVSSAFQAFLSIIKISADTDNALPSITFWLMGSLSKGSIIDVILMTSILSFSSVILYLLGNKINILSIGEDEAISLGINTLLLRSIVIILSTLITVVSVSICGIIGWIGIIIPNISRMIVGPDFKKLMTTSFLLGSIFLLTIDNIIRGIPGAELPLGVLTAIIGSPIFILILFRTKRSS